MRNLIIIGNGFDLAHDLKTAYYHFLSDIKESSDKYEASSIRSNTNMLLEAFNYSEAGIWSDIESVYFDILKNIKDKAYLQNKYRYANRYNTSKELNEHFEDIKQCLHHYLQGEEKRFVRNENYTNFFGSFSGKNTVIVNFNYTNTVKEYLSETNSDIELIQIHGELNNIDNPIIFGYAADDKESKDLLNENDNNFVRNIKKFNYLFTKNEEILKKHLNSEEFNVFVLGHSCGISDNLILSQILNSKAIHKIYPFYYKDRDGYFNTMVNIDRIIDDYSKEVNELKVFSKLVSFPNSHEMPQLDYDEKLGVYLESILNSRLPKEHKRAGEKLILDAASRR
ncbi:AbiH family protein [Carboxylicivirga sp. N1Y90]|uniref:AbiH family protein n=1 Tax=Carboxylicivirga fragile TaxID=3417571 RepID=UPI003D34685D|nr:hypothetical protein [Marinilabiliaceae bacterium N1Y90]